MLHERDHILQNLKLPEFAQMNKRNEKLNSGRWKPNEHDKFLEAIIIYGNDWKLVQKCIKSRSSTQARSHAQKFLLKLRKKLKIEPDSSNKLSKESIDEIVKEIIETSCLRNSNAIDRDKLVKLIMGFSNLLVGKVASSLLFPETGVNNNSYFNQDLYYDGQYPMSNGFFKCGENESSKKVFNIEKVFRGERRHLFSLSNGESLLPNNHFLIEKTKKLDPGQFNDLPKGNFQINQIHNQQDLIKYLFQAPQNQDPSNPNKNFINIISINICNKNEGDNTNVPSNNFANNFLKKSNTCPETPENSQSIKKAELNTQGNSPETLNLNTKQATSKISISTSRAAAISSQANEIKNLEMRSLETNTNNKTLTSTHTSSNNYEMDFYENSSPNYYIHNKANEDEYDKFFEWNN